MSIAGNLFVTNIQLIFKSNEKTLQNKEIEEILFNLQLLLTKKFNVIMRE